MLMKRESKWYTRKKKSNTKGSNEELRNKKKDMTHRKQTAQCRNVFYIE